MIDELEEGEKKRHLFRNNKQTFIFKSILFILEDR